MTDHPSAPASVPVETQECARLLVQELTPDQGQAAGKAFGLAVSLQSMLAAAPAAPQAAEVGEDAGARLLWNRFAVAHHESWDDEPNKAEYRQAAADVLALPAPSREPESGAVDDVQKRVERIVFEDFYGSPVAGSKERLAKALIREFGLAALATREEAPAEAGVPSLVDWFSQFIERHQEGCGSDTDALIACLDRVRDSYRAQPQAREDAQPVELVSKAQSFDAEVAWLHEAARYFSARDTKGEDRAHWANVYNAENANKLADRLAELSSSHCQLPPAPDALRRAVSDIDAERQRQVDAEGWSADRDDGYADAELAKSAAAYTLSACGFSPDAAREMWPRSWSAHWWKPTTARRDLVKAGALIVAEIERLDRQALAALQAEQGAK